ncbi:MAG: flagellar biosynthetic protein FliQ [Armatimonadota bacterium]
MSEVLAVELAQRAVIVALEVAGPVLGLVLAVSLAVSFVQAATQMHDPTINAVPRLAAAALAVLLFGGWMLAVLQGLSTDLLGGFHQVVP